VTRSTAGKNRRIDGLKLGGTSGRVGSECGLGSHLLPVSRLTLKDFER
jgi:hypothetical protein